MDFWEKLAALTIESGSKSRAAKVAGLPASAISNYISKRQMPRGDKVLVLAKALDVNLLWLLDENRTESPAPKFQEHYAPSPSDLSDRQLMQEVVRRRRRVRAQAMMHLTECENIDWAAVRSRIASIPLGGPIPPDICYILVQHAAATQYQFWLLRGYDSECYETMLQNTHPELGEPYQKSDYEQLAKRWEGLQRNPDFAHLMQDIGKRPDLGHIPLFQAGGPRTIVNIDTGASSIQEPQPLPDSDRKIDTHSKGPSDAVDKHTPFASQPAGKPLNPPIGQGSKNRKVHP
jgi:transcriptional regulator with XRE-family HTH domain